MLSGRVIGEQCQPEVRPYGSQQCLWSKLSRRVALSDKRGRQAAQQIAESDVAFGIKDHRVVRGIAGEGVCAGATRDAIEAKLQWMLWHDAFLLSGFIVAGR